MTTYDAPMGCCGALLWFSVEWVKPPADHSTNQSSTPLSSGKLHLQGNSSTNNRTDWGAEAYRIFVAIEIL